MNQKQKIEEIRNILREIGPDKMITKTHKHFDRLFDLVTYHPEFNEKTKSGVNAFIVRTNQRNRKALETYIKREDGSVIDFSWITCIKGRDKAPKENLTNAMRWAIVPQLRTVTEMADGRPCEICSKVMDGDVHVDHYPTSFKDLVLSFNRSRDYVPSRFIDHPSLNHAVFSHEDQAYEMEWYKFHFKNAGLRAVCSTCNLKRK